ncbi:MAG: glycosyltransferase family 2 protein [bacterium]|nr:glycosyltransferase family 2 protein [bacterium]
MSALLSILMITKNSEELMEKSLSSVFSIAKEIVIIDDFSIDATISISKKYNPIIFERHNDDLGAQRAFGLSTCKGQWILMLDADEIVSPKLKEEIKLILKNEKSNMNGYYVPYQNHLFGKPIYFGGENYNILRLFKRDSAIIDNNLIHEHVTMKGQTGYLKNKILHYSYRRPFQIIQKFTDYARRESKSKVQNNEKSSFRKLTFYPIHMIWARYIKDKGYKDGITRLFLDLAFGYMEFCTYLFLIFEKRKK